MKRVLLPVALALMAALQLPSQVNVDENDLKLEFEPSLFFFGGRSLNGLFSVMENNNLWIGPYIMTTEVPSFISKNMFTELPDDPGVKVTAEFALNARYRFRLSEKYESGPYVGLILGWENIRVETDGLEDLDISTFLFTPMAGFEWYVYKRMVYLNPQVRLVFYPGQTKSDEARAEALKNLLFVPSVSVGLRL